MTMKRLMKAAFILFLATALISSYAQAGVVGGYTDASVADKEVVAAANFAVKAQEKAMRKNPGGKPGKLVLIAILGAKSQVVAGTNFQLRLQVSDNGTKRTAEAVVWSQPWRKPNPNQLTSWTWK